MSTMSIYADSQSQEVNEPGLVHLRWVVTIGAAGVVASMKGGGRSDTILPAAVLTAAGQYTFVLDRQYQSLVGFDCGLKLAGATAPGIIVIASGDGLASPTIVLENRVGATPTNLASGDIFYPHFTFNRVKVIF